VKAKMGAKIKKLISLSFIFPTVKSWSVDKLICSLYQNERSWSVSLAHFIWLHYGEALKEL